MIKSLRVRGLLSFGWQELELPLRRLNIVIGPHCSGKSNFLDLFDLLRAIPGALNNPVERRGGAREWIHKAPRPTGAGPASLEVVLSAPDLVPLRYRIELEARAERLALVDERLDTSDDHLDEASLIFDGEPWQSSISQLRASPGCPLISRVAELLEGIQIYQEWHFGPRAPTWRPQPVALPGKYLLPDGSNLGLVLHRLRNDEPVRRRLRESLRSLYQGVDDIEISVQPEGVAMDLTERDQSTPTPASRMSSGTLRWLALLAILLDPAPPPLVCLEEPELGLHPDLISTLAGLLREASERTQLIVTTHSDTLVSEFTGSPEDVVVSDRPFGATEMARLQPERLRHWLERYSLGHVWMSGELGGKRW